MQDSSANALEILQSSTKPSPLNLLFQSRDIPERHPDGRGEVADGPTPVASDDLIHHGYGMQGGSHPISHNVDEVDFRLPPFFVQQVCGQPPEKQNKYDTTIIRQYWFR